MTLTAICSCQFIFAYRICLIVVHRNEFEQMTAVAISMNASEMCSSAVKLARVSNSTGIAGHEMNDPII